MKKQTTLGTKCLILCISGFLFATTTFAKDGPCGDERLGLYKVCDTKCGKEDPVGGCTTRVGQGRDEYYCCCKKGYEPKDTECGGSTQSSSSAASSSSNNESPGCEKQYKSVSKHMKNTTTLDLMNTLRAFRTEVLAKNSLGKQYIDLYYANLTDTATLLIKNPKLAKQTAKVLSANRNLIVELTDGKKVKIKNQQMFEILRLLREYATTAGEKSKIASLAHRLTGDLLDKTWLNELGISISGEYYNTLATSQGKDDDKDDDPTTCDKPKGGMCPNVSKKPNGECPTGCNKVNKTECSCKHSGPEGSSKTESWGDWICRVVTICW